MNPEQRARALEARDRHMQAGGLWVDNDDWLAAVEWAFATQAAGVRVVPEHLRKWCERYTTEELRGALRGLCTQPPSREEISKLVSFVLKVADFPPPALGEGWMQIETAPTEGDDVLGMIAIGRNAQANLPGEFVLNVELDKQQNIYTTFRTILSEPEFTMLSNILRRMIRDAAT